MFRGKNTRINHLLKIGIFLSLGFITLPAHTQTNPNCTRLFIQLLKPVAPQSLNKRKIENIAELNFATYNAYNLMQSVDGSYTKTETKRRGVAKVILENNLDVVVLQEIENEASLKKFNLSYLQNSYDVLLSKGNDGRGIQIAYLIKKDLPFQFQLISHAKTKALYPVTGQTQEIFSRDLPNLKIWGPHQNIQSEDPLFSFFGTHFKSKRDKDGDPQSRILREAQVKAATKIIQTEIQTHPSSFVMIAGDFNGDVRHEKEFDSLKTVLKDVFDLGPETVSSQNRITHSFHPHNGNTEYSQIDAFLVKDPDPLLINKAFVYRYKSNTGIEKPIPRIWDERNTNPSDHFPVIFKFNFKRLLQKRQVSYQINSIYEVSAQALAA